MPLVVVSDASPIRALHHLSLLNLFGALYGIAYVPESVRVELLRPTRTCPSIDISGVSGLSVRGATLDAEGQSVPSDLDEGETEAILLALELGADLLVIDERKGTEAARKLGLATIGVLAMLLEAKRRGLIGEMMPCVDKLTSELNFFISKKLRSQLAQLAGE